MQGRLFITVDIIKRETHQQRTFAGRHIGPNSSGHACNSLSRTHEVRMNVHYPDLDSVQRGTTLQGARYLKNSTKAFPSSKLRATAKTNGFRKQKKLLCWHLACEGCSKLSCYAPCDVPDIFVGVVPKAVEGPLLVYALVGVCPEEVSLGLSERDEHVTDESAAIRQMKGKTMRQKWCVVKGSIGKEGRLWMCTVYHRLGGVTMKARTPNRGTHNKDDTPTRRGYLTCTRLAGKRARR